MNNYAYAYADLKDSVSFKAREYIANQGHSVTEMVKLRINLLSDDEKLARKAIY